MSEKWVMDSEQIELGLDGASASVGFALPAIEAKLGLPGLFQALSHRLSASD